MKKNEKNHPHILANATWKEVQEVKYEIAILPWGATEAHNFHLPYATDVMQCDAVADASARLAWAEGAKVVVLPTVPFGVNTGQLDIPLCLNLMPSTQSLILRDLIDAVRRAGIRKLVILNGHGGNDFKQMLRELGVAFPDMLLMQLHWFRAVPRTGYFEHEGDHADELESSVMLHIAPQWVRSLEEAGDGHAKKWTIDGLNDGLAWAERRWKQVTDDTGVGFPKAATAEKGARFFETVTQRIAHFLVDLAKMEQYYTD